MSNATPSSSHQDVHDHLHILCNYEWDSRSLLSLLLVGLPELRERHQRSLYSRVQLRIQIDSANPEDTTEYLRHRLGIAGCDREVFPDDAIAVLHESAQGLPDLDRLAQAAMKDAARRKKKCVERDAVSRVSSSTDRTHGPARWPLPWTNRPMVMAFSSFHPSVPDVRHAAHSVPSLMATVCSHRASSKMTITKPRYEAIIQAVRGHMLPIGRFFEREELGMRP